MHSGAKSSPVGHIFFGLAFLKVQGDAFLMIYSYTLQIYTVLQKIINDIN